MHGQKLTLLLPIALVVAPVILAQTVSTPAFVVPAFADLTIKTRRSFDVPSSTRTTEVLYLKGARERREFVHETQPANTEHGYATITQCDQRRSIHLNREARTYAVSVFEDWSERLRRRGPVPERYGADVTTTFDAVDTGERRQLGRHVAHRVLTTITTEPSPGANTSPSTREIDGWYIDLPGLGCSSGEHAAFLIAGSVRLGGVPDRHHYKTKEAARRGYAIEETTRFTQMGRTVVESVELIELSERPVDLSLFDIPRDYRPALSLVRGGYDMTKPDTLANRVHMYWDELMLFARAIFR